MAIFKKSEKDVAVKNYAKLGVKIKELQGKKDNTDSTKKKQRLDKKISYARGKREAYSQILRSSTTTSKTTNVNIDVNFSKKTTKKPIKKRK